MLKLLLLISLMFWAGPGTVAYAQSARPITSTPPSTSSSVPQAVPREAAPVASQVTQKALRQDSSVAPANSRNSQAASEQQAAVPPTKPLIQAPSSDPWVIELESTTRAIRQLLTGEPATTEIDAKKLFDVDLGNPVAVALEVERLSRVVTSPAAPASSATPTNDSKQEANVNPPVPEPALPTPELRAARLALDQARLAFYALPIAERQRLLALADPAKLTSEQVVSEAERLAKAAEEEHKVAVDAAKHARSEAERLVKGEYAQLLDVAREQAQFEALLGKDKAAQEARNEAALGWARRVSEGVEQAHEGKALPPEMDHLYTELRQTLRNTRDQLADALNTLSGRGLDAPAPGPDPLLALPADIEHESVDAKRHEIESEAASLTARRREFDESAAEQSMNQSEALNRLRLRLLPALSSAKRTEVTGLNPTGWDQAAAEVRQVFLTVRYHLHASLEWMRSLRGGVQGYSAFTAFSLLLKCLFPVGLLILWRRNAEQLLAQWQDKLDAKARKERMARLGPSTEQQVLVFLRRTRRPLEWALLVWVLVWLLPANIKNLLEVEVATTVFVWMIGGILGVASVDALVSEEVRGPRRVGHAQATAALRLDSLRLVGRAIVTFGLILSLSERLVGQGTIYSWVFSTCWFAAIPLLLVLIARWRAIIFERLQQIRKKDSAQRWMLANQKGAASFAAAVAGGLYLFSSGILRVVRSRLATFTLSRRILAYLFRRDLAKKAHDETKVEALDPLPGEVFEELGPENPSTTIVPSVADVQVQQVIDRINAPGGGVFAIVGERGTGKTTLMARIAGDDDSRVKVCCESDDLDALRSSLCAMLETSKDTSFEQAVEQMEHKPGESALLIDDAHLLILPMMNGLVAFDQLLNMARQHSTHCIWVFAIDEALWRFLERARGAKPLFDGVIRLTPWREEGIARLLTTRSRAAKLEPNFERLLAELPDDADQLDREEALQRTEASYYRLLWDYAGGNPGVALHFWRKSLGVAGNSTLVRLFSAPPTDELETLPDSAIFVLRAIVQLGWAGEEQVAAVTSLPLAQVRDALRYGSVRGYFDQQDNRYRITWNWFRSITRLLQRRHLIFIGS